MGKATYRVTILDFSLLGALRYDRCMDNLLATAFIEVALYTTGFDKREHLAHLLKFQL